MKTDGLNLTTEELDELCRLYMDCKLSVLEEKELEYILSTTSLTSDAIAEVRALMNIQLLPATNNAVRKKTFWNRMHFARIAASVAVVLAMAVYFLMPGRPGLSENNADMYIAAYSNGKRLNHNDAVEATNLAIAKADSLMHYASLTRNDFMNRASIIISETLNN